MSFTDKTALVTGGSRGIGRAVCLELARQGCSIALCYAGNQQAAQETVSLCQTLGVKAAAYRCDVANDEEVKNMMTAVLKNFGAIHILVNNAGITRDGLLMTMKEQDFDAVLDTNLKGAFNMIRHCTSLLLRAKTGCITNISSVSGLMGNAGQSNYAASKAGMIGLTKSVAKELASKNIRCNAIAPGFIQTDMTETQADNPLMERIPMGRMGEPEDVAEAVWYLVQAKYVTGEVLRVDGGLGM